METVLSTLLIITSSFLIISSFKISELKKDKAFFEDAYFNLSEDHRNLRVKYQKEVLDRKLANEYVKKNLDIRNEYKR